MKKTIKSLGFTAVATAIVILAGCASLTLVSLETDTIEGPRQVRQGRDIDPASISVWGIYKDDSRKQVRVSASNITFDKNTPGAQTVRVRVSGQEASFQTQVMPLLSITVASPPTKVDYLQGEALDIAGLRVTGDWEGFSPEEIRVTASDVSGFNATVTGVRPLTVTAMGKSATFDVDVWALTGIMLDAPPNKTTYSVGDRIDLTGIVVNGNYSGSTSAKRRTAQIPVNQLTTSGFNSGAVVRNQRVTVTVSGQSANFFVNIEASIVGTWKGTMVAEGGVTGAVTMVFKPDLTGTIDIVASSPGLAQPIEMGFNITYTTSGNTVTYRAVLEGDFAKANDVIATVSGNTLTIPGPPPYTLTRQ
jgi:hypothetical protein